MSSHRRNRSGRHREGGFTLIEVLIVIVILGILAGIVAIAIGSMTTSSETASCKTEGDTFRNAVNAYRANNGDQLPDGDPATPGVIDGDANGVAALLANNANNLLSSATLKYYAPGVDGHQWTYNVSTGSVTTSGAGFCG